MKDWKTKHGHAKTRSRTYVIWMNIRQRCNDVNVPAYKWYGGRGISICSRWDDFSLFLEDMGECPNGMSIDRIDNDDSYSPENCRWATMTQQANNRRDNKTHSFNGESKTIRQWEAHLGMKRGTLHARITYYGWSIEKAITTPVRHISNS